MRLQASIALLFLTACGAAPPPEATRAEVLAALATYDTLILRMDHDRIAATFTDDGEVSDGDQAPLHGPAAIRSHLLGFAAFHVLSNHLEPDTTRAVADTAWQTGTYRQRVRTPAGDTVEASGRFAVTWLRAAPGQWRIRRMHTFRPPPT